jgi:hypothetical protein
VLRWCGREGGGWRGTTVGKGAALLRCSLRRLGAALRGHCATSPPHLTRPAPTPKTIIVFRSASASPPRCSTPPRCRSSTPPRWRPPTFFPWRPWPTWVNRWG